MGSGSFPGVKRPRRDVNHPPPSSAEVKETVELYVYSPSGPSWPAICLSLPFTFTITLLCYVCKIHAYAYRMSVFVAYLVTTGLWNKNPASAGASLNNCRTQDSMKERLFLLFLLGAFPKLRIATIGYVMLVCPHGTARLPLNSFSLNLILEYFSKIYWENSNFNEIWQEWRVLDLKTDIHFWSYPAEFLLEWEMFQTKVVLIIRTQILRSVTFFPCK